MSMHFRPKIQNGQIARRSPITNATRPSPRFSVPSSLSALTPVWAGVSVTELAHTGLSALALDGKLKATETTVKSKAQPASRARVLVGLIGCGALLAAGFMFSLRDHFMAYACGREEVQLKSQVDQISAERRTLEVKREHAVSPPEIDRLARQQTTLAPIEMDQKKALQVAKKPAAASKLKTRKAVTRQTSQGQ